MTTKTIEQSFVDWESYAFGFGYGTGEEYILSALKAFFDAFGNEALPDRPDAYDHVKLETAVGGDVAWLLINALCRVDVIEYGTSPRFGWLTEPGRVLMEFIKSRPLGELVRLVCENGDGSDYCTPDVCNCGPRGYEEGRKCINPFWSGRTWR